MYPSSKFILKFFFELYYFWIIAKSGSISAATSRLLLNQSTLSQQLQQLQRQNSIAAQQPSPAVNAQAAQTQVQINQQAAELNAARMQALSANPADVNARLQQSGAAIQQIQPPPIQP